MDNKSIETFNRIKSGEKVWLNLNKDRSGEILELYYDWKKATKQREALVPSVEQTL